MRVAPGQGTRLDRPRQASMQLRRALSDPELRRHQTVSRVGFTDWGQAFDSAILNRQAVHDDPTNRRNARLDGLTPVITPTTPSVDAASASTLGSRAETPSDCLASGIHRLGSGLRFCDSQSASRV